MNNSEISTPCFIIRKEKLEMLTNEFVSAYHGIGWRGCIGYSMKTNNLPWIAEYMKSKGLFAEVVSSDEYNLAKEIGFTSEHIIFNGPVKGKNEFIDAVSNGSIVNIDSNEELQWLKECSNIRGKVGLRVNFDLESECPGETQCGEEDGRFGFSYELGDLKRAMEVFKDENISLSGLHLHCSSKTRSINIYKAIAKTAVKIVSEYQLHLNYIDIGGGFFGGVPGKPTFLDYFTAIKNILDTEPLLKNVDIILEPGMALIGASVDYSTTVTDIRHTVNNCFIQTDGSRIHVDPLMRKRGYSYYIEKKSSENERSIVKKQTISGFTCMEGDRLFQICNAERLKVGDKIVFEKVGGYTMGLSPLFIQFYPAVYVEENERLTLIRKKWTAEMYKSIGGVGNK